MHETNGRFSQASRFNVTLFIHVHVSAVGRAEDGSVLRLFTIWWLYPQRISSYASAGLQTMHTATQFKWAGANCACVPVIKKFSRRNSLRRSQHTIVHHCTFCTSANSYGIRGTSARVLFRKGGPNNLSCNSLLKKAAILDQQNMRHALRSPPIYCSSGLDYLCLLWWSPSASQPV